MAHKGAKWGFTINIDESGKTVKWNANISFAEPNNCLGRRKGTDENVHSCFFDVSGKAVLQYRSQFMILQEAFFKYTQQRGYSQSASLHG